jgi:DNA-binding MarR family transcriptional regulator
MKPVSRPTQDFLGRRIAGTHRVVQAGLDLRMRTRGGDFTTWKVLMHLTDGESPSQRELAARMLIDPATLVRHLDRVEADGLVARERDERDRRVVRVVITRAGWAMHKQLQLVAAEFDQELRDLLERDEYERLVAGLQRITDHFSVEPRKERIDAARHS